MKGCYVYGHGMRLCGQTFLEDLGPVDSDEPRIGVLVLLAVVHDGRNYGNVWCDSSQGPVVESIAVEFRELATSPIPPHAGGHRLARAIT